MCKLAFTPLFLLFVRIIAAQNLSPTVVNSSGGVIGNSSNILEWSLGELAAGTLASPANFLTQGFLQPDLGITPTRYIFDELRFSAFPNPVSGTLTLQTDFPGIATVSVHDVWGRLVLQSRFQPVLDLQMLNCGVYVVFLRNEQNQLLHSFKINKI